MGRKSRENTALREFVLANVEGHPHNIVAVAAAKFGVTRATAHRYVKRLVTSGIIEAEGATKARLYRLARYVDRSFDFKLPDLQEEHVVWRDHVAPLLRDVAGNISEICQYGLSEMVNNVIDHSESKSVSVHVSRTAMKISFLIDDSGIGIFEKIQRACGLDDARAAVLELSKGKLTTDPSRHTGEGIFFTSRMFQVFAISSGELFYRRTLEDDDEWLIEVEKREQYRQGTVVWMEISTNTRYTALSVMQKYEGVERSFSRTHVPVRLARYGDEQLVSRSQARRVLARFSRFAEVMLDFHGVPRIGQAFADEIFRVFRLEHPEVTIIPLRTSPDVQAMIHHVTQAS